MSVIGKQGETAKMGQDPGEPGYGESIDMLFTENGSLTLRYREVSVTRP
jgi:hypothetical protein